MYQEWFAKFCAGDFLLDDAPQSGRPVEVDSDQINTLIENNQHYATWETADILKISKSIKLLVKMKNVSFILWKKLNGLFGWPNRFYQTVFQRVCTKFRSYQQHVKILVALHPHQGLGIVSFS